MLRSVLIILLALGLTHCGKESVKDEPITQKEQAVETKEEAAESPAVSTGSQALKTESSTESSRGSELRSGKTETSGTENLTGVEKAPVDVSAGEESVPKAEVMDSTEVFYMIRPNDYLVKIAINEYGRPTMWRKIWKWNYNTIGDNPNLIYPYRELSLLKPVEYAVQTEFSYYDYIVKKDDTLWSIAKEEYGNNLAWIVILRDNYDALHDDYDNLVENSVLKLRTKLY